MEPVIVAHGLWMPGTETALLRRRLARAGFEPHLFRFRTVRNSLEENVALLAGFAAQVPGETLHFVGYSLGGIVTLELLRDGSAARPGRIVCLGSPLRGSRAAARLARSGIGRRIVGKSMLQLLRQGGLAPWPPGREVGMIAGRGGIGLGRILGVLPNPNDGTVALDETDLEGLTDRVVLNVTHTSMLFSRAVADCAVAFLRTGRFG